ncbi:glycosyltransferase family 8 protein [uncultured Phascolarctobacterium sp.]|uniref:glycosyltransferase family 8 protein n=1 Tax=uncultured Phascolarctobacterium sp. TaxID=512296 RepID=UPI0025D5A36B|nr:glycosyltransferase family 8 protein [uncultured Phascolarctobacterium sp.]
MIDESINIVLATDKNYAQHATVAMTSVLCNTARPEAVHFFVIDDGIDEANKAKMRQSVAQFSAQIDFVCADTQAFSNVFVSGNLTRAAYLRLDIPNIVPEAIKKVIYLDCDLLVLADIAELWRFDMQSKPLAAAEDFGILSSKGKCAEKAKNLGWQPQYSYFNSGVLLMDLQQWRQENISAKLVQLIAEKKFRHHDQDALNYLFMNRWAALPLRWNVIPPVFNMMLRIVWNKTLRRKALVALADIAILHYAGGYKPWEYAVYKGFNDKYYEYLSLTEYRDAVMPQPNLKKKKHSISRQLWRLKWADLVKKIF